MPVSRHSSKRFSGWIQCCVSVVGHRQPAGPTRGAVRGATAEFVRRDTFLSLDRCFEFVSCNPREAKQQTKARVGREENRKGKSGRDSRRILHERASPARLPP
jgi:hypothetical protein